MTVTVNGQARPLAEALRLDALIATVSPDPRQVIAEVNGTIIKQPAWAQTLVRDGDRIELVRLVGGG